MNEDITGLIAEYEIAVKWHRENADLYRKSTKPQDVYQEGYEDACAEMCANFIIVLKELNE